MKHFVDVGLVVRFGTGVTARREEMGLTMRTFADQVGVSQPHLYAIEQGTRQASLTVLIRILKALNCKLEEIL